MALDEIKAQICGKWKLDRSENFDEFLKELGLNVVFRKMAESAKPVVEFTVEDNTIKMISKVSFFNQVINIKLDGEYQQSFEGTEMNCNSKWENNKLITEANPIDGKGKTQKFQRERVNDELVQTMWAGDVVCVRTFKPTD
ncbi:cellular retinoic acid-binding protein 2-like [Mytilus californianus]|uniref:cellular retinoic acid-binding protein 2-like n=1 Tax=Mytilus californianus TaxID=6549 RepID=UPI0022476E21|nr:cellular retinoic acid-binding protein 2-like [Mytilus californianus]